MVFFSQRIFFGFGNAKGVTRRQTKVRGYDDGR